MRFAVNYWAVFFGLVWAGSASASFHLWDISEIYSNDDGTIQFIELFTTSNSQQFTTGKEIKTDAPPVFSFPNNTPSPTRNHNLLLATAGFSLAPGSVAPDFTIPDNFFNTDGDTINFVGADTKAFASLPIDGADSLHFPGATIESNSPTNYAGDIGSIVLQPPPPPTPLQAGDSDQDLDFDQLDLIPVLQSAKYRTGESATWGEGDWNGAPGGSVGNPPTGDGLFDQVDILAALQGGLYQTGSYAALSPDGVVGDEQTSLVYDAMSGELKLDAPSGRNVTSINVTLASARFIGDKPAILDGAFDNFSTDNVFKATFGGSFGDISFGSVLPAGLSSSDIAADLSAVGSLEGGGDLGPVDLVYVPEPASVLLLALGMIAVTLFRRSGKRFE